MLSALTVAVALTAMAVSPATPPCGSPPATMACVPGGPFERGRDDGPRDARPTAKVHVSTFWLDRHEVTVAAYAQCVAAGRCDAVRIKYKDFDRPDQPMVGVSWHDAARFCAAQGKRLPTEAEWEKAARGADGEAFPWGDAPATCDRAVIKDARGRACGVRKRGQFPDKGRTWAVGSKPPERHGVFDLGGNAQEWVADWYSESYAACGAACAGPDPKGPCGGASPCKGHRRRVVRGGSWYWPADHAAGWRRRAHVPSNRPYHHFGFRCAAEP